MSNNVVTFDNKEYEWKEVAGKGRCLVPYVKPVLPIKVGDFFKSTGVGEIFILTKVGKGYAFVQVSKGGGYQPNGRLAWGKRFTSMREVQDYVRSLVRVNSIFIKEG